MWLTLVAAGCLTEIDPSFNASGSTGSSAGGSTTASGSSAMLEDESSGDGVDSGSGSESGESGGDVEPPPVPGYEPRDCGFDLNDDNEVGDDDDCTICNGQTDSYDIDPLGMQQIYVDCDAATGDGIGCGGPEEPCNTLGYALANVAQSVEDAGPVALCFRGTCTPPSPLPLPAGAVAWREAEPVGSQEQVFHYPTRPMMVVGWDYNADGVYPPASGETAVIDAAGIDIQQVFVLRTGEKHDIELAHFTVRDILEANHAALLEVQVSADGSPDDLERLYAHDLSIQGFRSGEPQARDKPLLFLRSQQTTEGYVGNGAAYLAFEHSEVLDHSGPIIGEEATHAATGPLRLSHLTTRARSCSNDGCSGARALAFSHAGPTTGVEIVDSVFGRGDGWVPANGSGPSALLDEARAAVRIGPCMSDVLVRNNRIEGYATGVRVVGQEGRNDSQTCTSAVSGLRIVGNRIEDTDAILERDYRAIDIHASVGDGDLAGSGIADVTIAQNVILAREGWAGCIAAQLGIDSGTTSLTAVHNTCVGRFLAPTVQQLDPALLHVSLRAGDAGSAVIRNNILLGRDTPAPAVRVDSPAVTWTSDFNVYGSDASFRWDGDDVDLAGFQGSSGQGAASVACTPTFVGPDGPHLSGDDACAVDFAEPVDIGIDLSRDIDGDPREAAGPVEAGADERPATSE
ncbi:MAG: hypothetical protein AAF721_05125 [Myxococcota bacterium]